MRILIMMVLLLVGCAAPCHPTASIYQIDQVKIEKLTIYDMQIGVSCEY